MLDHCMLSKQFQCILTFILKISGSIGLIYGTPFVQKILSHCVLCWRLWKALFILVSSVLSLPTSYDRWLTLPKPDSARSVFLFKNSFSFPLSLNASSLGID